MGDGPPMEEKVYEMAPVMDKDVKDIAEKDVEYKVKHGDGKTYKEISPWGAEVNNGRLMSQQLSQPDVPNSPFGEKERKEVCFTPRESADSETADSDTESTATEDWLGEKKVHWEWTTFHITIAVLLTIVMVFCIGVWGATKPAEIEGDEFPRGAHLLSVSASHAAHLDLKKGHPDDSFETILWIQPHEHALELYPNNTDVNITIEGTTDKSDPNSWVIIDGPKMLDLEISDEAKDYKFELSGPNNKDFYARMVFTTTNPEPIAFAAHVIPLHSVAEYKVLFAALILLFEYTLIVFELIDRTLAAMLGSFVAVTVLGVVKERPDLHTIINWIDFETVLLLFGMMIMVRIFSLTGVFEFCAVKAYKLSGGDLWKLTWVLCTFTAITSAFLDNVTTMLLLTPVTCRLCNILKLDPTILLLSEVMFSNIGGAATAVGDPPNIIIVNDNDISSAGIGFAEFTLHMACGSVFVFAGCLPFLKWMIRDFLDTEKTKQDELNEEKQRQQEIKENPELEKEAARQKKINLRNSFCQETAPAGVGGEVLNDMTYEEQERFTYAKNHPKWNLIELAEKKDSLLVSAFHVQVEVDHFKHNVNNDLLKRILIDNVQKMESEIRVCEISGAVTLERTFVQSDNEGFETVVKKMEENYQIMYKNMFVTVGLVLGVSILLFFVHSAVHDIQLDLAWIAVLGAIVALVVSGIDEPEKHVLNHVEWGTLLFFAALFVLMEALTELGLIDWLGDRISEMINSVDGVDEQMTVALLVLVWVSGFASAFIDNIPYTTAMVPVIINVAESTGLPLKPLVFALAFGTCLGGNGTLIGASANVVTVGIAKEAYGKEITFVRFMKFGLPVMVVSITIAFVYLVLVHPVMRWNM